MSHYNFFWFNTLIMLNTYQQTSYVILMKSEKNGASKCNRQISRNKTARGRNSKWSILIWDREFTQNNFLVLIPEWIQQKFTMLLSPIRRSYPYSALLECLLYFIADLNFSDNAIILSHCVFRLHLSPSPLSSSLFVSTYKFRVRSLLCS